MHYIFVSTTNRSSTKALDTSLIDLQRSSLGLQYRHESRFRSANGRRALHCYSYGEPIDDQNFQVQIDGRTAWCFHGYFLGDTASEGQGIRSLRPERNYYGVYSHGRVSDENCYFASDEIGLSPLYYSRADGYLFVSNNPHLIARYRAAAGLPVLPEDTLPIWHTIKIAIESDNTGYQDVFRVLPWRYVVVDPQDGINFPSKDKTELPDSWDDCVDLCVDGLRGAMSTIGQTYDKFTADLTGGFDSRLTMAFIVDGGLKERFQFTTTGNDQNPDVIVAKELAALRGLDHVHRIPHKVGSGVDLANFDDMVRSRCIRNAMETSLIRSTGDGWKVATMSVPETRACTLNGKGAVFAKSLGVPAYARRMQSKFRGEVIDFDHLTLAQQEFGPACFGYGSSCRDLLTDAAIEVSTEFRRYIFDFGYSRIPLNMGYAESMSVYQYRTHNANLAVMDSNCIFLYSPQVLETSRRSSPLLRAEAKLYFDILYRIDPELCFVPYENRKYHPDIYAEYPDDVRSRLADVPSCEGSTVSETNRSVFEYLLPVLREGLLDMLPDSVYTWIRRDALDARLKEDIPFGTRAYPLISLYGIAKWHDIVRDEFSAAVQTSVYEDVA